jgi:serine/threonine protein kinase
MTSNFIGRTISGRYRLEALLGDGGMGTVYRAYDVNLDRQVALKLMHAHFARQEEFRARLIQEARTAAQLDHPSVVRVYDFGESEQGLFIAMEYINGGSLRAHLRRVQRMRKFFPLVQSLQIGAQIAEALDYAHNRKMVHRDIKPGNILLKRLRRPDEPGEHPFRALLTDFGLVKLTEGTGITQSGATLGTPTYMSPEQCAGEPLDGRADIYALGVVLYELFTNRLPFDLKNLSEAIAIHRHGEMPPPAHQLRPDVPKIIDDILMRTLAKSAAERYETGGDLADALRGAILTLEGAPTKIIVRGEMDILEKVSEPPPGHELIIETPGHPPSTVPLTDAVITLGRHKDNDIVLPAEGVSRQHAQLQATALGWVVIDKGGINGTYLNDRRLRAEDPTPLSPGSRIRIGPYELMLQGPEVVMTPEVESNAFQPTIAGTAIMTPALENGDESEPLSIFLPNDRISVEPGEPANVKVEVVNHSNTDDRVTLRVHGLPDNWVSTPDNLSNCRKTKRCSCSSLSGPPRHRSTPSGRQRFRIELVSQKFPGITAGATASLLIGPFVAFEAGLEEAEVRLPGIVTVNLHNTGNTAGDFSVVARDHERLLTFRGERGRIRLQPGQRADVGWKSTAPAGKFFGRNDYFPFEIDVVAANGGRQTLNGEAQAKPPVPQWLVYLLFFFVVFACAFGSLLPVFRSINFLAGPQEASRPAEPI